MKHDDLQEDLATHLRGNTDRMVWTNTQLGPVGSPRPDVFTVDKSFARFAADAYEVKVSVSDLRHDDAQVELGLALGMPHDSINATTLRERLRSLRWKLHRGGLDGAITTLQHLQEILAEREEQKAAA